MKILAPKYQLALAIAVALALCGCYPVHVCGDTLELSNATVSFNATVGGPNPPAQSFDVAGSQDDTYDIGNPFTASSDSSWLTVTPTSGKTPASLKVRVDITSLAAGTYTGHVSVGAPKSCSIPGVVTVTLTISAAAAAAPAASIAPSSHYWSVALGDLNGNGIPDFAAGFTRVSSLNSPSGFVAIYLQDPAKPGDFLAPAAHAVAPMDVDPVAMAIGDLNGDGKADIVTANGTRGSDVDSTGVSVFLQDSGNPGRFLAAANYDSGNQPSAVAIGDLNGDGKPDLAVAGVNGVSVFFQDPAKPGRFLPPTTVSVGSAASSVAIADLNGDGKPDLVVATGTDVVVLLQSQVLPGTFPAAAHYGAGSQPAFVAVGDLNGDGKPDLAVANSGSDPTSASVSVLFQNPAAPGTFLTALDYRTDADSRAVAIADVNGDGKPDLVVANGVGGQCAAGVQLCGSVSVLLQNPIVPGEFQAATNYPATDPVFSVAVGDMNGDGKPDLVIAQRDGIAVRFQDPANPGAFLGSTSVTH